MKPIIFSTPMVKAILEGKKTMTRRIIKPPPGQIRKSPFVESGLETNHGKEIKIPYQQGGIIWVRERFTEVLVNGQIQIQYFADEQNHTGDTWKPSIHMPRVAARIFLEVKKIYPERLLQITNDDALAEGIEPVATAISGFRRLWDDLNEKRGYAWDINPWVWVIKFSVKEIKTKVA